MLLGARTQTRTHTHAIYANVAFLRSCFAFFNERTETETETETDSERLRERER